MEFDDNDHPSGGRGYSKKNTPCRHSDGCYLPNCPYKHPSNWHPCQNGARCTNYNCKDTHPPSRQTKCRNRSKCRTKNCQYLHPSHQEDEKTNKQPQIIRSQAASSSGRHLKSLEERVEERKSSQIPIFKLFIDFCKRVTEENVTVFVADTGSGKSSQIAQYAADCYSDSDGLVVCTQPQPSTAITLARRVAQEYDGTSVGNSVGYQIGYNENRKNDCVLGTNIMFMTESVLIQQFQMDSNLNRIKVLIIDEAHNRSLNTDTILGIAKLILTRRSNFHAVLLLPPCDYKFFTKFFGVSSSKCVLSLESHLYPVQISNRPAEKDCPDYKFIELHLIPTLQRLYSQRTKNILVFLSSQREIEKAIELFNNNLPRGCSTFAIYESMSPEEQETLFEFNRDNSKRRMVIFCTSFAETSIHVQNVDSVIDTGLIQQFRFHKRHGIQMFETVRISQFSAEKRKDLAGETKNGVCIRLYDDDELKTEYIQPEIARTSLALVLLQLKCFQIDPRQFPFLSPPDNTLIGNALNDLESLQCLDKNRKITKRGELFANLCIDPQLSAFLIDIYTEHRKNKELLSLANTIVGILSVPGSIFSTRESSMQNSDRDQYNSDLLYLCHVFNEYRNAGTINPSNKKCTDCNKISHDSSEFCSSCRLRHATMNRLNYPIVQVIDSLIEFYRNTILDARWKLTSNDIVSSKHSNEEILSEYLQKHFPAQIGHFLISHLPDEGVRLIQNDIRATVNSQSTLVQRALDDKQKFFVTMSISKSFSGRYTVDHLHPISSHGLSELVIEQLLVCENIGWTLKNEVRNALHTTRSKWLVQEHDQVLRQLTIWGLPADRSHVESALKSILSNVNSKAVECGSIKATFQNGFICSAVQITEKIPRLDLQKVPCRTYGQLLSWLKKRLNISQHDIKENNFKEGPSKSTSDSDSDSDDYEATPFYILFRSMDAYERAATKLPAHHICPPDKQSSSTTGTHMNEKHAWGRQLVLTIPVGAPFISAQELLDRLAPHAVDCRQFGKRNIRAQPAMKVINLARDTDETNIRQILQPINPVHISIRKTHGDGLGSATAHIFFSNVDQRKQSMDNLQTSFCTVPVIITVRNRTTHKREQRQIYPAVSELRTADQIPLNFLITTTNRHSTNQLFHEIIPKLEPQWTIDSTATVTVTHSHLYPDFDALVQQIAAKFEVQVQQQNVDKKQVNGQSPIRCFFNHGPPKKTAAAAAMLSQSTSPILIKINDERQKQLFDELFATNTIQNWATKLKLEVIKKDRGGLWIEIRGPQVQQGDLMREIADYSDKFDERFRVLELNSKVANFFGPHKAAYKQLESLNDEWSNWGCSVKYVPRTKSIIIYGQPSTKLSLLQSCVDNVENILSKLSTDGNAIREKQQCVFCKKPSYSTNKLRACGHAYCRCAATHLANTLPLQCAEPSCKKKIDMADVYDIFPEREDFMALCKRAIQLYFQANASTYDQRLCPNVECDGLVKHSGSYQVCMVCGRNVCPSCDVVDDDSHQGRTCAERAMFQKMGDFLPNLYKQAEKFARDNWTPQTPPIIRVDYNLALATPCGSMQRFNKGVQALGHPVPLDMTKGFFAFHGTAPVAIKPICIEGFDPKKRAGQACGPGEYFGVTSTVSHGYSQRGNTTGPYSMIIAYLLTCPQLTTSPGFCYVMNNPTDWSYAYNVPVVVVSYGPQASCESPLK